jgi:hypothetical protein
MRAMEMVSPFAKLMAATLWDGVSRWAKRKIAAIAEHAGGTHP